MKILIITLLVLGFSFQSYSQGYNGYHANHYMTDEKKRDLVLGAGLLQLGTGFGLFIAEGCKYRNTHIGEFKTAPQAFKVPIGLSFGFSLSGVATIIIATSHRKKACGYTYAF